MRTKTRNSKAGKASTKPVLSEAHFNALQQSVVEEKFRLMDEQNVLIKHGASKKAQMKVSKALDVLEKAKMALSCLFYHP